MQNFKEEVLDRSAEIPVLVDFWAPWCGPCRVLGPVLERLADQQAERWALVKVNTDEQPELSAEFGIRGIPAVKLFVDGVVVDEFTGALPEPAVKQWLDKAIPGENKNRIDLAREALSDGDDSTARRLLGEILETEPTNPEACGLLARVLVWDEPEQALALSECAATGDVETVHLAAAVTELATALSREHEVALPDGAGKQAFARGIEALRKGDAAAALELLIQSITVDRYYFDDRARKLCIAIFVVLGADHTTTRRFRKAFDMSLY